MDRRSFLRRTLGLAVAVALAPFAARADSLNYFPSITSTSGKLLVQKLRLAAQNRQALWQGWGGRPGTLTGVVGGTQATFTGSIANSTATFTASTGSNGYVVTASTVTGTILPGATLTGAGWPTNTVVVRQLSGTAGGAGTYQVNQFPSATGLSSVATTATYGVLTASSVVGTISPNDVLAGPTLPTAIVSQITGASGGAGTYLVNQTGAVASVTGSATAPLVSWSNASAQLWANAGNGSVSGTTLTVAGTQYGTWNIGMSVAGPGCAGMVITANGTGTGGNGTYTVNNPNACAFTSQVIVGGQNREANGAAAYNTVNLSNTDFSFTKTIPVANGKCVGADNIVTTGPTLATSASTNTTLGVSFMHTGSRFEFASAIGGTGYVMIVVDDQLLYSTPQPLTGNPAWSQINFGSVKKRRIDLTFYNAAFCGVTADANDSIERAPVRGPTTVVFGDSYTAGGDSSGITANTFAFWFGLALQWDNVIPSGVGGTGYVAATGVQLVTNASSSSGGNVLNFASTAGVTAGQLVYSVTAGIPYPCYVQTVNSTNVTLVTTPGGGTTCSLTATINSGAGVQFGTNPAFWQRAQNDLAALNPEVVLLPGSVNDDGFLTNQVTWAANTLYSAVRGALPNALFLVSDFAKSGPNTWGATKIANNKALKAAAAANGVTWIDIMSQIIDPPYGSAAGSSATGSITGYVSNGQLTVTAVKAGSSVQTGMPVSGAGLAAGTVVTGFVSGTQYGAGVYTLSTSGQTIGGSGSPVTFQLSNGGFLLNAASAAAKTIVIQGAPARGSVIEIDTGLATMERIEVIDYYPLGNSNGEQYYGVTFDGALQYAHASGAFWQTVGGSCVRGHGQVGTPTGWGNSDFWRSADGTHPVDFGHMSAANCLLTQFLLATAPN